MEHISKILNKVMVGGCQDEIALSVLKEYRQYIDKEIERLTNKVTCIENTEDFI